MKQRTGTIVIVVTAFCGIVLMAVASALRPRRGPMPPGTQADYVLIEKRAHRLTLFFQHRRLRSYRVALGRGGLGLKRKAGDGRTPEGLYRIEAHQAKRNYPYALRLDYPSERDVAMARRRGSRTREAVLIHGMRNGLGWLGPWQRLIDWTGGSVALSNEEMAELYFAIPDGTPVEIRS